MQHASPVIRPANGLTLTADDRTPKCIALEHQRRGRRPVQRSSWRAASSDASCLLLVLVEAWVRAGEPVSTGRGIDVRLGATTLIEPGLATRSSTRGIVEPVNEDCTRGIARNSLGYRRINALLPESGMEGNL